MLYFYIKDSKDNLRLYILKSRVRVRDHEGLVFH